MMEATIVYIVKRQILTFKVGPRAESVNSTCQRRLWLNDVLLSLYNLYLHVSVYSSYPTKNET